jgi:hypothetical protein
MKAAILYQTDCVLYQTDCVPLPFKLLKFMSLTLHQTGGWALGDADPNNILSYPADSDHFLRFLPALF